MVKSRVFLGMVIPPLIGNPYNGYIDPYYWVDDHPLLYGKNGSLDPGTYQSSIESKHLSPAHICPIAACYICYEISQGRITTDQEYIVGFISANKYDELSAVALFCCRYLDTLLTVSLVMVMIVIDHQSIYTLSILDFYCQR